MDFRLSDEQRLMIDAAAGSSVIARAADTHVVLEAAGNKTDRLCLHGRPRTFDPLGSFFISREGGLWNRGETVCEAETRRTEKKKESQPKQITAIQLAEKYGGDDWGCEEDIVERAVEAGISRTHAEKMVAHAKKREYLERKISGPSAPHLFRRKQRAAVR